MTARQPGISAPFIRFHASGWIISLCLHGSAILLAGLFVAKIGLAPPSSSFQWDVTVVASQPPATNPPATPDTQTPAAKAFKPAQRTAPATSVRSLVEATPPTMTETTPASVPTDMHHIVESVPAPLKREPRQPLDHITAVPLPEPQERQIEPQPTLHATSADVETPSDAHAQPQTTLPPVTTTPLAAEPSLATSSPPPTIEQPAAPAQVASLVPSNSLSHVTRKPDYSWLAEPLLQRIEALKQYPLTARLHRLEGRVVVRIVIQEDGQITLATIAKSSGHDALDRAALETIRQASPLTLSQPLEKPSVTMQIPLGYYLER